MQIFNLALLAFFYLAIFMVGLYASCRNKASRNTDGLFVASRELPLAMGVFTMTATWVGGGYINGTAEAIYDPTRGIWWCQAPVCFALSLIVGGWFFARPMRQAGYTTMLDPFQQRYGNGTTMVLFATALLGEIFWSAAILAALGSSFNVILGYDPASSILISAAVVIGYTVVGGLWSVAYTDAVQLVCIVFGLCMALPFVLEHTGGLAPTCQAYFQRQHAIEPFPGNSFWNWLDTGLMLILGGIPWQSYFQRVLACRDERTAANLSYWAGGACLLLAVPPAIIGAVGATIDWQAIGLTSPQSPSLVLPHVIHTLAPPHIATIALAAITAAVMSSLDASVLSGATMFVWNIYQPTIGVNASPGHIRWALRVSILVVGASAAWLALTAQSVYVLWYLCADLVYVLLFPQLVLILFDRRIRRREVNCGLLIGLVLRMGGGEAELGIPAFIPYPMGKDFPIRTVAMLVNLMTTWLLSIGLRRRA
jgi:high affinity choline transporter 7